MESLFDVGVTSLEWVQLEDPWQYFLRSGEKEFAYLNLRAGPDVLGSAETADGSWTFKRVGLGKPCITVRVPDSDTDAAVYRSVLGDGDLTLPDGRSYTWKEDWSDFEAGRAFCDAAGSKVLRFSDLRMKRRRGVPRTQIKLELVEPASGGQYLPMLACLGTCLWVQGKESTSWGLIGFLLDLFGRLGGS